MSDCKLNLKCSDLLFNTSSYDDKNRSVYLQYALPGNCATIVVTSIGFISNVFALIIFYQLDWFTMKHMRLFVHSTIAMLSCTFAITFTMISLTFDLFQITSQMSCVGLWSSVQVTAASANRFALVIGIDRFVAQWAPCKWSNYGRRYYGCMICVPWLSAIVQESVWFRYVDPNECVSSCMGTASYPDVPWLKILINAIDTSISICVIAICAILPYFITWPCCTYRYVDIVVVQRRNRELYMHRHILIKTRTISFILLPCFVCSLLMGSVLWDMSTSQCEGINRRVILMQTMAYCISSFISIVSPFLYLIDREYRTKVKENISSIYSLLSCQTKIVKCCCDDLVCDVTTCIVPNVPFVNNADNRGWSL